MRMSMMAAALVLAACGGATDTPQAAVEALYAPYVEAKTQPPFETSPMFTQSLRDEIDRAIRYGNLLNEPVLDFDPISSSQDGQVTDLSVKPQGIPHGGEAVVVAHFKVSGDPRNLVYEMKQEDGAWKVDNIRAEGDGLRAIIEGGVKPLGDPAAMKAPVEAIYARYAEAKAPEPLHRWAPLSESFRPLMEMASAQGKRADGDILGLDPVTGGAAGGPRAITDLTYEPASSAVIVRFKNEGQPQVIVYDLAEENGAWKIFNIRAPNVWDVRQKLMDAAIK